MVIATTTQRVRTWALQKRGTRHATVYHHNAAWTRGRELLPVNGDVMRLRDSLLSSSTDDDLWSVVSDDLLNVSGVNDDYDDDMVMAAVNDVHRRRDDLPTEPSTTTTPETTTTSTTTTETKTKSAKSVKMRTKKSVVRRNERERNRVKQVNYFVASQHQIIRQS